jgi:UDP-N-acetylmuramoyl-L-alanyl-D-glutamate--2,6-diaminopimelate ligase
MTKVVTELADQAWATADNPRKESIQSIFADMREGLGSLPNLEFIPDRREAIGRALATAKAQDCVLIAGKGHETTQEFFDTVVPFDDRLVVRQLLELRKGAAS